MQLLFLHAAHPSLRALWPQAAAAKEEPGHEDFVGLFKQVVQGHSSATSAELSAIVRASQAQVGVPLQGAKQSCTVSRPAGQELHKAGRNGKSLAVAVIAFLASVGRPTKALSDAVSCR